MTFGLPRSYPLAVWSLLWALPPIVLVLLAMFNLPMDDSWLDAAAALLGPLVAYSAGTLAYANLKLAQRKREDDLFDRRIRVFWAYRDFERNLKAAIGTNLRAAFAEAVEYARSPGAEFSGLPNRIEDAYLFVKLLDGRDTGSAIVDDKNRFVSPRYFITLVRSEAEHSLMCIATDAALLVAPEFRARAEAFISTGPSVSKIVDFVECEVTQETWMKVLAVK